jgi:hypothetical protein
MPNISVCIAARTATPAVEMIAFRAPLRRALISCGTCDGPHPCNPARNPAARCGQIDRTACRRPVVGIAFHQWADFSWALVFFGVFGKWTANRPPAWLAVVAVPWGVLTSAVRSGTVVSNSHTGSASLSIYHRHPCTRCSPDSVARPLDARHLKAVHSSVFGALALLAEFCSLRPPCCSASMIARNDQSGTTSDEGCMHYDTLVR